MTLWFVFALMTVAAIFAVLWPLGRGSSASAGGSEAVVYRDQLAEIDRDVSAGLIGVPEAEAARVEISRRLLAATDSELEVPARSNIGLRRASAIVALVGLPLAAVTFGPQLLTPAGLFQPSRTWALSMQVSQPLFEGGQRKGLRRQRESVFEASRLSLEQLEIEARSEVRIARAAIESRERALASARQAAQTANEVLKITIVAFDAGSTTNSEVIDAQRSARDLELVVVQAEDAVRQARLDLLVALGMFPK